MTKAINSSATVVKNLIHGDIAMRKVLLCLAVSMIFAPGSSQAQVTLDMSRITCADYVAMSS
jgi:hypothetical protein